MARQLVFTSAPQGLTPGRTGFSTVARHGDLRERLVPLLEGLSVYPPGWQPPPVICAFRLLDLGGTRIPVLSRVVDAGQDYTHRTNFLAHHLILDPDEIAAAPTPADIFLRWPGWLNRWEGAPRWLAEADFVNLAALPPTAQPALPAQTWGRLAGDPGRAALLLDGNQPATRVLRCAPGAEDDLLALFRESAALLDPGQAWRAEFTTCIQITDTGTAFRWAGLRAGSTADTASTRPGNVLDLTQPDTLPPAPVNTAVRHARSPVNPLGPAVRQRPLTAAPPPRAATRAPVSPARRAPAAPPSSTSNLPWIVGTLASLLVIGLGFLGWMSWNSSHSAPNPAPVSTIPATPVPVVAATPTQSAAATGEALADQQLLEDIQHLADDGQFLEALTRWRELADKAPDLASAHASFLNTRLLPGAQKDWQTRLDQITAKLNAGPVDAPTRASLATQLATLRDFPNTWPVDNHAALEQARVTVLSQLTLLGQLPDAPAWIIDDLAQTGAGSDYADFTTVLGIQELNTLLTTPGAHFHVSCAAAANLTLPPPAQWYSFDIQPDDFSSGNYLILHDATRGAAGGRFLQLLIDSPGKVRLVWRGFVPTSDFFQLHNANAPLRAIVNRFWLHFAGDPPLSSFYLLLRRPAPPTPQWQPLRLPFAWLNVTGTPALVSLPAWLTFNLPLHAPPNQSFWLVPATHNEAATAAFSALLSKPAATLAAVQYQAGWLVNQWQQLARDEQTDVARATQHAQYLDFQNQNPRTDLRPEQGVIDQARQSVEKLQSEVTQAQTTAQIVGQPGWPPTAAPWSLIYTSATHELLSPLLEFSPDATGPTP
jgi:hypothetical protein